MSDASTPKPEVTPREIVAFKIGDQAFCMEIEHVLEIRGWTDTTRLPHAPDYVVGLMNLRGAVLPVLDLSMRLGMGRTDPGQRHVIIIARIGSRTIGFLVDGVSDILTIKEEDMKPTPDVSSSLTQAFIKGVYTVGEDLVRAIDVHQILPKTEAAAS